jgi:hypothetical protein
MAAVVFFGEGCGAVFSFSILLNGVEVSALPFSPESYASSELWPTDNLSAPPRGIPRMNFILGPPVRPGPCLPSAFGPISCHSCNLAQRLSLLLASGSCSEGHWAQDFLMLTPSRLPETLSLLSGTVG